MIFDFVFSAIYYGVVYVFLFHNLFPVFSKAILTKSQLVTLYYQLTFCIHSLVLF